jgi:hypothetical protein
LWDIERPNLSVEYGDSGAEFARGIKGLGRCWMLQDG